MDTQAETKVKQLAKSLPKFPDGRIDYTNAKEIYGVSIVVEHAGKVLFLKRAADLHFYPDLWNVVSGFIDDTSPLGEHVYRELKEETGIEAAQIADIKFAKERYIKDNTAGIEWHIYPVLVRLANPAQGGEPTININWEHTEYHWVMPDDVTKYDRVPLVEENIRLALDLVT